MQTHAYKVVLSVFFLQILSLSPRSKCHIIFNGWLVNNCILYQDIFIRLLWFCWSFSICYCVSVTWKLISLSARDIPLSRFFKVHLWHTLCSKYNKIDCQILVYLPFSKWLMFSCIILMLHLISFVFRINLKNG
jgi:hypothetical protein